MKSIDFVVRDNAGAVQRGVVPADGLETAITLSGGLQVSLNVQAADIALHERVGDDLLITLTDGRLVRLENYFDSDAAPNQLYISTDGNLNDVLFVETAGGELIAQYGPTEQWGKWSPADDLIFLGRTQVAAAEGVAGDQEVSMLAPALLGGTSALAAGGAAVAGLAAVGGLAGGGGDDTPAARIAPTVNDDSQSFDVGGDDPDDHTVTVTGTGNPGDTVTVTVGDQEQVTIIGTGGVWTTTFEGDTLPLDGAHDAVVVVTGDDDSSETLDGPSFVIDTVPPVVTVTTGTGSAGDAFNASSFADGVTIGGTGEPGAQVTVTVQGGTRSTTITESGDWSVSWAPGELSEGDYQGDVTIRAVDAFGNSTTISDTLIVDTLSGLTIDGGVEGDGIINAEEASDGVTFTGSADPGSSVTVTFGTSSTTVVTGADGRWSAGFAAADIPSGEYESTITAVATDPSGNASSATSTVNVDTLVNALSFTSTTGGADGVINATEAQAGLVVTGVAEPGATVTITLDGATASGTANASGDWTVNFPASAIAPGTYSTMMSATAIDLAGNSSTITQTVTVDTEASVLIIDNPIAGDDVINGAEAADGVMLSGTADPGALVTISMAGVTHDVVTQGNGVWQAFFAAGEVAPGEYDAQISATTTDAAGNTATASDTVRVDTRVETLTAGHDAGADNIANAAEASDGITLSGQVEPGSSISVDFAGTAYAATVDAAGNWSLLIPPAEIAAGDYSADILVTATDAAGNVDSIASTLHIDTDAPAGPVIESFTRDTDGIRGISTEQSDGDLSVARVDGDNIEAVSAIQTDIDALGETNFAFTPEVPDGSHLVVNATDAAGNTRGTYVVLDDESAGSTVDLGTSGLGNYNVEAVDLQFAEEASLTITEAQLVALSAGTDTLTVHGGSDDTVTLNGAVAAGNTAIGGQGYDVYTLGAGTVIIDEDIQIGGVV